MHTTTRKRNKPNIDKISGNLEQLKEQINDFIYTVEGKNAKEPKCRMIKVLTTKTKHLLKQHKELKQELQYYENMYKKALVKNVQNLKSEIKENQIKLRNLKKKCQKIDVQVQFPPLKIQDRRTENSKRSTTIVRNTKNRKVFKDLNPRPVKDKLIKIRSQMKRAGRKNFKQKRTRINNNIKIRIKTNETGGRELYFFKTNKTKQSFSNLVQEKENKISSFRECRITLQKLTEEQARRYTTEKKSVVQQQNQELPPKTRRSKLSNAKLNWQIRIPRSVLEESQKIQNFKLNVPNHTTNGKRTRTIRLINQ
nr:uncharacterized protein LOC117218892 [Megalopta genalis]